MGDGRQDGTDESGFDLFDRWLAHRDQERADVTGDPSDTAPDPAQESPLFVGTSVDLGVSPDLAALPEAPIDEEPVDQEPVDQEPVPEEPLPEGPASASPTPVEDPPEHRTSQAVPAAFAADAAGPVAPPDPGARVTERGAAVGVGSARLTTAVPTPEVVRFPPRTGARRVLGLVLLVVLAATAVATYVARQDRTTTSVVLAGVLALLTAVVWAVRAGAAVTTLTVRGGQLEILRGGSRHQFDLTSRYTPIDVVGEPGSRTWKVLFHRRSMAPFVVDASMVDPVEFTRVVRHYRPAPDEADGQPVAIQ